LSDYLKKPTTSILNLKGGGQVLYNRFMTTPYLSPAFILRRNAFRDNSLLLDLFSLDTGKITCVAKFSKGQGTRSQGMLEPFRLLDVSWVGKGEVFTLFHAEEVQRFTLKGVNLLRAVYMNELLLRTLWKNQPQIELFHHYQHALTDLQQPQADLALPIFELAVLNTAGYELNLWQEDVTGQDIQPQMRYRFRPEQGLSLEEAYGKGVPISGQLLIGLREPRQLTLNQRQELRQVIDHLFQMLLKGKTLHARKLLHE
jgi:DNA repair protein RecO (recombination protein O)